MQYMFMLYLLYYEQRSQMQVSDSWYHSKNIKKHRRKGNLLSSPESSNWVILPWKLGQCLCVFLHFDKWSKEAYLQNMTTHRKGRGWCGYREVQYGHGTDGVWGGGGFWRPKAGPLIGQDSSRFICGTRDEVFWDHQRVVVIVFLASCILPIWG